MQNLFFDTRKLDESCRIAYGLTEEIMMENAAAALERAVRERARFTDGRSKVLILCGPGNNGADGYALARRLRLSCNVVVFQCARPRSELCIVQAERAEKCGTVFFELEDFTLEFVESACVIVDCIYGTGFRGSLDDKIQILLNDANDVDAFRIACDVPSGIDSDGNVSCGTFRADLTVTMGALKLSLFHDLTKDYVGEVVCAELGVARRLFENSSNSPLKVANLLEEGDMFLPHRRKLCVNKGSFGHAVVAFGEKMGASILAGISAVRFGAGLVTLVDLSGVDPDFDSVPAELMTATEIPAKTTAVALGMGLGRDARGVATAGRFLDYLSANPEVPCVIDADACYSPELPAFLRRRARKVVLTPHPREFQTLLSACGLGEHSVADCVTRRPALIEKFCRQFPKATVVVKGANPMIGQFDGRAFNLYVNPYGRPCLAKGGSGDVLSGMVAALLAQKYRCIDAAATASLAHALASRRVACDFAMTPAELVEQVAALGLTH